MARARRRTHWRRAARGPGRHALRPRRAVPAHRDRRGGASGARRGRRARRASACSELVSGLAPDDLVLAPDLRRRLVAAAAARAGPDARRQAGGQPGAARSGASIGEMNCVRRHLSAIKGGRLAAACHPARVGDAADLRRAGRRPDRHRLRARPSPIRRPAPTRSRSLRALRASSCRRPCARCCEAAPAKRVKPGDPRLAAARRASIAAPQMALEAAAEVARDAGIDAHILGDAIEGEARDVGKALAGIALQVAARPARSRACVLLSGGETTVTRARATAAAGATSSSCSSLARRAGRRSGHPRARRRHRRRRRQEEIAGALSRPTRWRAPGARAATRDRPRRQRRPWLLRRRSATRSSPGPTLTNVNDFRAILSSTRRARPTGGTCDELRRRKPRSSPRSGPPAPTARRSRRCSRPAPTCSASTSATARTTTTGARSSMIRAVETRDRPADRRARWTCRDRSCASARFAGGPVQLGPGGRFRLDLDATRRATPTRVAAAASGDLRGARAGRRTAARRRPAAAAGRARAAPTSPRRGWSSAARCPTARASTCRAWCCRCRR